jgi:hypothetical protein
MKPVMSSHARFGVILLVVGLLVAAAVTATTRAASVRTEAKVTALPHLVSAGETAFVRITFLNKGPSTVNHGFATVTAEYRLNGGKVGTGPLPLPNTAFDAPPAGCSVTPDPTTNPSSTSTLTCDLGQVRPGTVVRTFEFTAPTALSSPPAGVPAGATVHAHVDVSYDESKGTQLADTASKTDDFYLSIASSDGSQRGVCDQAGGTLDVADSVTTQRTSLQYGALPASIAHCTPASAGVANGNPSNGVPSFSQVSFVEFLDGAGLGTVNVYFPNAPQGVTKKNLALYEMARFPIDLTATLSNSGSAAIPKCPIPNNSPFHSCLLGVDNWMGGGLVATLLVKGGNTDPGWGGIG